MAKDKIQAIKGMADMLPEDTPYWDKFTQAVVEAAQETAICRSELRFLNKLVCSSAVSVR